MQTHGGEAAERAILARERHFINDVRVDWAGDGSFSGPLSDLSPFVEDISVNRALEGSVPEEISVTEGASAAELSITLSGIDPVSGLSVVEIFSEFNKNSPLYGEELIGVEVRYWIWVETEDDPVQYPQFVGNIRTIEPDRESGTVVVTALDRAEKLRQPVTLVPWAYSHAMANVGLFEAQLQNPQGVIDSALRGGGVSPTPFVPPYETLEWLKPDVGNGEGAGGFHFYLTGTGSVPLRGMWDEPDKSTYFDTEGTGTRMFAHSGAVHPESPEPGRVPLGIQGKGLNSSVLYYRCANQKPVRRHGTHFVGFTLLTGENNYWRTASEKIVFYVETEHNVEIRVHIGEGQVWATWRRPPQSDGTTEVIRTTPKVDIPTGQPWVRINIRLAANVNDNTLRATVTAGSNTTGDVYVHVLPSGSYMHNKPTWGRVMIRDHFGLQDIYYSSFFGIEGVGDNEEVFNKQAPYVAVLDPGLSRISNYPAVKAEDGWDLIKEVASAELGAVFWDENGVFHFWNYNTIQDKRNTVVKTLTPDLLAGLKMTRSLDSLRNELSVSRTKSVASAWRSIYEAGDADEFRVPPNTRRFFTIQSDDFIAADDVPLKQYKDPSYSYPEGLPNWNQYVKHGFVVQIWDPTPGVGWRPLSLVLEGSDVPLTRVEQDGTLTLEIWNRVFDNTIRFALLESEEPALRIGGSMRVSYDDAIQTYKDDTSISKYGRRNLQISNRWIQFGSPNTPYASYLSSRASQVVPVADQEVQCPGDPRIQLGDTIEVRDEDGFGESFHMQVTGITRSFSPDEGLVDTYTVELFEG